jgi:hypothetical protein
VQQTAKEVKLNQPKNMPTIFLQQKGWLSTAPNEMGVIIPIRTSTETFERASVDDKSAGGVDHIERDSIDVKSDAGGDDHIELAPHKMIVLGGEVRFKVSDRVPFELILHPTSPIQNVEPVAEQLEAETPTET